MQLQLEFEKMHNIKFISKKSLKSKYDGMRKQYSLWKTLKNGETGLGWNASIGKLDCSDAWLSQKIEDQECLKRFMVKQDEKQDRLIEILKFVDSGVNRDDPYSASRCMSVINGMIDGGMMPDDIPLCYLAMDLLLSCYGFV
ncbi:myb/SANT-like domain-containing protein [Artemisia annua]|uniref:Myb/SANT-like domain-containing protein n=1 Tax=Artemisia annua TaxID=35608 RepID=A0A2U1M5S1_ARTAN|nr:myb/SANT-like domain-containing protein [Artemisia annua]